MKINTRLSEYVRACFTGIWIESHEHQDALTEIAQLCHDQQWQLATWDIESGLNVPDQTEQDASSNDPLTAIRSINALATPDGTAILILQNFHRFLQSAEVVQALARQIITGKQNRTIVVVLSPVVQIPTELEKMFVVMEHDLPNRLELEAIARGIATEDGELPEDSEFQTVIDSAAGLTRMTDATLIAADASLNSLTHNDTEEADKEAESQERPLDGNADDLARTSGLSSSRRSAIMVSRVDVQT